MKIIFYTLQFRGWEGGDRGDQDSFKDGEGGETGEVKICSFNEGEGGRQGRSR